MDSLKAGALIRKLRLEQGMTQSQLAKEICVSDKTVSKWERGQGSPDVSVLGVLSGALHVKLECLLTGDLGLKDTDGGNMKRIRFYACSNCGNILMATGDAEISCCGRKLIALMAKPADDAHRLRVVPMEDEYYITFDHPMEKGHYLSFVAYAGYDRVLLVRLYPEQGSELRIPQSRGGKLYFGCSKHGLFVNP